MASAEGAWRRTSGILSSCRSDRPFQIMVSADCRLCGNNVDSRRTVDPVDDVGVAFFR